MGLYEETLIQHDYIEIREADVLPDNLDGVWLGDLILIKRVDICEDYINLVSLNPKYDDIKVASFSNIKVMGKVVL